jgi:hypothetical protein
MLSLIKFILEIFYTVDLSFLKRERERFLLLVPKR